MPVNVVKTEQEERYWSECKESVRKSNPGAKGDRFYKIVQGCFQKRKGNVKSAMQKRAK